MPIYVYKCEECGRVTEVSQRISDAPLTRCELRVEDKAGNGDKACEGTLTKQVTSAKAHFKGSGFYETDYKKRGR